MQAETLIYPTAKISTFSPGETPAFVSSRNTRISVGRNTSSRNRAFIYTTRNTPAKSQAFPPLYRNAFLTAETFAFLQAEKISAFQAPEPLICLQAKNDK